MGLISVVIAVLIVNSTGDFDTVAANFDNGLIVNVSSLLLDCAPLGLLSVAVIV